MENKLINQKNLLLNLSAGMLLVVLVVVAYIPAMSNGFVWDDDLHITQNVLLRTNDGLRKIWFEPGSWPHYYPLVLTSFWIQYHLWGYDPFGYHVTNIIIHGLSAVLLWLILRKLNISGSWLAASIFALHPVHVESVAWASENKNILSGFFYLSSLLVYIYFVFQNRVVKTIPYNNQQLVKLFHSKQETALYFSALILFLCALFAKTVTCSLPAVILLLIWWKHGRITRNDLLFLLPFFVFGLILGLSTVWTELYNVGSSGMTWKLTYIERILIAGRSFWFYIGKLIWPVNFAFIYPKWDINTNVWWQYIFPSGCLALLLLLLLFRKKTGDGPLVAALIFGGTLFPALGFFNLFTMRYSYVADHFQYLASISLITLFSVGLTRLLKQYDKIFKGKAFKLIIYGMILIIFGVIVWNESYKFKSLETLWRDTIAKNPKAALAHLNLSIILTEQRNYDEAIHHAKRAIQVNPSLYEPYNSMGNALSKKKKYNEAIKYYAKAIQTAEVAQVSSAVMAFHFNMGKVLVDVGKINEGISHFNKALELNPDYVEAHNNLGSAFLKERKYNKAIKHFAEAIRIKPSLHYPYANMGVALVKIGRVNEGISYLNKALKIKPDYMLARQNLQKIMQLKK